MNKLSPDAPGFSWDTVYRERRLLDYTAVELKKLCGSRRLTKGGNKQDKVDRLNASFEAQDRTEYRKRFAALRKIEVLSGRASIVARALAHVAKKPSLLWLALSKNHDILYSYLDESLALDDAVKVPSRKRSRSSSSDAMCSH
jgi:hypothetical protein